MAEEQEKDGKGAHPVGVAGTLFAVGLVLGWIFFGSMGVILAIILPIGYLLTKSKN